MTTSERGFTLIEVIVVLSVMAILAGTAIPLVSSVVDSDRRQRAKVELDALAAALEEYYFDHGAFPTRLDEAGFFGTYLSSGVGGSAILDPFARGAGYVYARSADPDVATIHSVGEDGQDTGFANEEFGVTVRGAGPGLRKTRLRMLIIVEALARFLEAGGVPHGNWSSDRARLGLGPAFANDGFGSPFTLGSDFVLKSAGPDRTPGTADDLTN